jgi:hypothetical protein
MNENNINIKWYLYYTMAGRLIDGVKYVGLMNDNSFKTKSLEDNVYFTLRDIVWNGEIDDLMSANHFNGLLTNNVSFMDRDKNFAYANILYDYNSDYTQKLYKWLMRLTGYNTNVNSVFEFHEVEEDEKIDMANYMKYDDWWDQLQVLIRALEEQLENHKNWEAYDIQRDCDRIDELEQEKYLCEYGCGGEYDYEHEFDNLEDELKGKQPFDRHKFD